MGKDPAFPLYTQDFLVGTMYMSNEQTGIYIKLLCSQHQHGGVIDHASFDSMVGDHKVIRSKFTECEDGYYNERLMAEMIKRQKKSTNLSRNALIRWGKLDANAMQMDMPSETETENEIEKKKKYSFDPIWALYPKKLGKKEAFGYFNSTVRNDKDYANIKKAIKNYIKHLEVEKVPAKYIKNGGNFFDNWEDWVDYVAPEGAPEEEKGEAFDFHKVKAQIEDRLCKIATPVMIEKLMRELPESAWWMIDAYLKRRYPGSRDTSFMQIESKLKREAMQ